MTTIKNPVTVISGGGGGGDVVNGVIEQYKASTEAIDVDTFVEFVNDWTKGARTVGDNAVIGDGVSMNDSEAAIALGPGKVLVLYRTSDYSLYGVVCTIDGTTITKSTATAIATTAINQAGISGTLLESEKVFITYYVNHPSDYSLYGVVCTIDGTTITKSTATAIATITKNPRATIATLVANKVFIGCSDGEDYPLYGIVCTIDGTTITKGTNTAISLIANTGYRSSPVTLSSDKVFVAHNYSENYYVYGIVCTIDGTTITKGTDTSIANDHAAPSAVLLRSGMIFIAYHRGDSTRQIYGVVCSVDGANVSRKTRSLLRSDGAQYGRPLSAVLLRKTILISYTMQAGVAAVACEVSGTTITRGSGTIEINTTQACGTSVLKTVSIGRSKVLVAYDSDGTRALSGTVCSGDIRISTAMFQIDGLTKTECTTDTAGDVWALNS